MAHSGARESSASLELADFIPASEFASHNIPDGFRTDAVLKYIRNISARTVRVIANNTSPDRPASLASSSSNGGGDTSSSGNGGRNASFSGNNDKEASSSGNDGKDISSSSNGDGNDMSCSCNHDGDSSASGNGDTDVQRLGSGWVVKVEHLNTRCQCPGCESSPSPSEHCWAVIVNTAPQVVLDSEEARGAHVELFFDDSSSRADGKVVTLHGTDLEEANPAAHVSCLVCLMHDASLARQLDDLTRESMALRSEVLKEWNLAGADVELTRYLVVCHPQGLPKHVWVSPRLRRLGTSGWMSISLKAYCARATYGVAGAPVVVLHGKDCPDSVWLPVVDGEDMVQANTFLPTDLTSFDISNLTTFA